MTKRILAYSPWGNGHNTEPFGSLFDEKIDGTESLDGASCLLLWGGTDIHPSYYKQRPHQLSGAPTLPSVRDQWEWKAMLYCRAHNIPIIGVCRGAQFLCAFAGGKLIQHVNGHSHDHYVQTVEGLSFRVTSSHHQMLDVSKTKHELLAWSNQLSTFYYGEESYTPVHLLPETGLGKYKDPEIVYFPGVKGLAIQGHPEWAEPDSMFSMYCVDTVNEYLLEELNV